MTTRLIRVKNQTPPKSAVLRLSAYLRLLETLAAEGSRSVASSQLARRLGSTAAQVRKDLACFGQFGRRGVGYDVSGLAGALRHVLGTDQVWNVVLVGAGDLGSALMRYRGFGRRGFKFVAAFDVSPGRLGTEIEGVPVMHIDRLAEIVRKHRVKLAVVAVPNWAAQQVVDQLCEAGVTGILNFAPAALDTPATVSVGLVDLAASLEQLSFRVGASGRQDPAARRRKSRTNE